MGKLISRRKLIFLVTAIVVAFIGAAISRIRERKIDYNQFFAEHQEEMTAYAEEFLNQENIDFVGRYRRLDGFLYLCCCRCV